MENKAVEFLIPWSVVSVPVEDLKEIFDIDNDLDATLAIRKLEARLQNCMDSFDLIRSEKLWGIKRIVAGYVVHDDTIYFTVTGNGKILQTLLDKRFKLVASNETK